jgi:hypothetical protein
MKKLSAALLIYFGLACAALAQSFPIPASSVQIPITGTVAASTRIVTGVTGKQIIVTSIMHVPVPTAVVTYTTGTGTNCGTSTASITGALTFSAGQVLEMGSGYGAIFILPPGFDLCITIATAVAPGSLTYTLFAS